ncbi:OprO/OprP family phosphate-selective porin [Candidatus Methylocalor cossyra]|uniref:Phosphate-selective porin OprO and OprP n=1 Tax=Candidatus Methylocalor cossyra TaxID=3108543 RepID=A0ABP1CC77_9GAMM
MSYRWSLLLAGLGLAPEVLALTDNQRLERLERHILELEKRLEASEAENARLRAKLPGTPATSPTPAVEALDQKVKVLERKLEVEKELAESAKQSAPRIEAGPGTGFRISSANGDHQLRLRGYLQADGDFFLDDGAQGEIGVGLNPTTGRPNPIQEGTGLGVDKFWIRRARLLFAGTLFKHVDFLISPDFGQGQARLFDGWVDLHYFPFASLAAGKQKGPVSLERLQSATNLLFAERAYPTLLAPNRDIGVMLHGEFAKPGYQTQYTGNISHSPEFFSYQLGVFNGTLDNQAVQNSDNANFDNKAFEGRIFAHPFQHSGISALEGLGIGVAGTYADITRQTPIPNLVSPGQNTILSYATGTTQTGSSLAKAVTQPNTPGPGQQTVTTTTTTTNTTFSAALSNGDQTRIYPQGYWYWGPFGLFAEYVSSTQHLAVQETNTTTTAVTTAIRTNTAPNTTSTLSSTTTTATARGPRLVHRTEQRNQAWQVAASYVLTGEDNSFQGVRPRHAFNPLEGHWGALQLAARWSELDIDKDTFKNFGTTAKPLYLFADPRSSVRHATSWAVGVNWFLNQNVKLTADYEQTQFDGGAVNARKEVVDRPTEKVFFTRFQFAY